MLAMTATSFGGPEVLRPVEVPDPEPGGGELLVDVTVAGVLWLDAQIRAGNGPSAFATRPPYVPGGTVGGTVTAVGDGVDGSWLGRTVVARAPGGGYRERVTLPADTAFGVPDGLGLREATALLDDGSTAVALLERTPVHHGERVLVQPAAGGLGSLLVQLAVGAGARVIGAARGADKLALVAGFGATPVDYDAPDLAGRVLDLVGEAGVDVAFDGVGGALGATAADLVVTGGRFSSYGMAGGPPTRVDRPGISAVAMEQLAEFWPDTPRRVEAALAAAAAGRLRPVIGQTYPLADAATAHADLEARRIVGKSLLVRG